MSARTRELLLSLARNIIDADSQDRLMNHSNLQKLRSSLESVARSVVVTHNEFSLISKLPPGTLVKISEFVVEPRTRESVFEIVKMTHICQYWRSTLISYPHLWSSIFVKNDHKDFVAACLERSREVPLTVRLDLKNPGYYENYDCTCRGNQRSFEMGINVRNPCRYHTTIGPLLEVDHLRRIHKLDVHLTMLNIPEECGADWDFRDVLEGFKFFASPLPELESLNFHVNHDFEIDDPLEFPKTLFSWVVSPPTELRHLVLHNCYGGPIGAVRNLTSFELTGVDEVYCPMELNQDTFLPFISGRPSLISLSLSHFTFPKSAQLSQVTPAKLPGLKSLRLMDVSRLSSFPGLIDIPALNTLSSLRISARKRARWFYDADFLIHAESDDGFQLSYNTPENRDGAPDWLGVMCNADPHLAFVRFDGQIDPTKEKKMEASPLLLFVNARVLEVGASFADRWYRDFWKDLRKVGPQLTTLRLEVIEGMKPAVATSVEKLVKARFKEGMPLAKLERMRFEEMSEEGEEKAKKLWDEFRAGLDVDRYLSPQRGL